MHQYIYSGLGRRLFAKVIDCVLSSVIFFPLLFIEAYKDFAAGNAISNQKVLIPPSLIISIIFIIVTALFNSSRMQGTPGKYFLRIKIITKEGNKLSFLRALGRISVDSFPAVLSIIIGILIGGTNYINEGSYLIILNNIGIIYCIISIFFIISTQEKTSPSDIICSTRVIRTIK